MHRRQFGKLLGSGVVGPLLINGWVRAQSETADNALVPRPFSPVQVDNRVQLFVDQTLVRESEKVAFTLHPAEKHPLNPLVKADRPWEVWNAELFGTVLYDEEEKLFKMWYTADGEGYFQDIYPTFYATSQDGIHWEKPLVGTLECKRDIQHNAVTFVQQVNVMKDNADPDPARRYKMVGNVDTARPVKGYFTFVSPDGLNWKANSTVPLAPIRLPSAPKSVGNGDNITAFYDKQRRLYVAFPKIAAPVRGYYRRSYYMVTSPDLQNWTEPLLVLAADERDDAGSLYRAEEVRPMLDVPDDPMRMRAEFYVLGFYPTESCTLSFISLFTVTNQARGNVLQHEGPSEVQLAVSRNLTSWERPFRVPCIPRGTIGEWDSGFFMTASQALRVGDEIWLYYHGTNYTHGTPAEHTKERTGRGTTVNGAIGLAKWRLDRFVSADGLGEGSFLRTVPIVFSGGRLEVNARVAVGGALTVEIQDAGGRPLPGFAESELLRGDSLRHTLRWKGANLVTLSGKPVMLKFHLKGTELYSFAFRA